MPLRLSCSNYFLRTIDLILFHCTFLALKAEDSENPVRGTVDDELHGEKEYFGGYGHSILFLRSVDNV